MFCWHCGKRLAEEAESCPACGMIVVKPESQKDQTESAEERVHSLLTQANLLRVRREWQAAILRCTEALKISPNSASAHSLLGDICRDEGRLRDAMEWYKLALTLDPTRRLDREKLDALIDRAYGSNGERDSAGEAALRDQQSTAERVCTSLRIGVMSLVALILVTLAAYLLNYQYLPPAPSEIAVTVPLRGGERSARQGQSAPGTSATSRPIPPSGRPPRGSNSREGARRSRTLAPLPEGAASIGVEGGLAEREQRLVEALSWETQRVNSWSLLLGIKLDPRRNAAEVAFSLPYGETLLQMKQQILGLSLSLGREAVTLEPSLEWVEFRAHLQLEVREGLQHELVFIGESSAQMLREADAEALSVEQARQLFSGIWWHPLFLESQP
ncbi:MAG: hypothetical protein GTO55_05575 [Armatimonadetes bacterium]|nr:hypothetical protein [Armatimonadota bacterium]NIM23726.1 hypothetical protein [Armatimonadota bacterium]NIM67603.1 hypothetical protein [Armatimonadota bacterium]NIM76126.1 hypothetical protein [Armatimonadota bacterium]NIN05809.1 hypothetical protein [Armatimonadota bacterium]